MRRPDLAALDRPRAVVEWHRPGLPGQLYVLWAAAGTLIGIGLLGIGLALDGSGRVPPRVQAVAGAVGALCAAVGPLLGTFGSVRVLDRADTVLVVLVDGLLLRTPDRAVGVAWDEMAGISWSDGAIEVRRPPLEPLRITQRFMGHTGPRLAERLETQRRHALLGTLRA